MSENLHDIDKLFRDGIEAHEDMPSAKVWEAVDAGLDKNNVVHIKRKYNNLKRIAAILLLLLLSVVGYEIFKTKTSGDKDIAGAAKPGITQPADKTAPADKETAANEPASNNNSTQTTSGVSEANGSNAQSGSTDNAGYDSLKNNVPAVKDNSKVTNRNADNVTTAAPGKPVSAEKSQSDQAPAAGISKNNMATTAGKNKKGVPAVNDAADNNSYRNAVTVKRPVQNKTRIRIQRPQAEEDAAELGGEQEASEGNAATTASQLMPLENTKVGTLAQRINNAIAAKEAADNRQSPDVAIKKMRLKKSFHFSLMPFFSPQFVTNNIKEENHHQWTNAAPGGPPPPRPGRGDHKEQYKEDEQKQTAYSMGVLASVPLGKNWSVQSGITYLSKNISIEPKKIYARPDKDGNVKYVFDCSSGYSYISAKTGTTPAVGDSINTVTSKNSLGYVGIPLSVNYSFSIGKFSIIPGVGGMLNFLTKQKIQTELVQGSTKEQQSINKIEGLKKSYLNATAGLAVEYNVNKRIALNIMPAGSFALTSINNSDAAVKSYPNAFGISGGVKIKF